MVTIELDREIRSPSLRGKIGIQYTRMYGSVHDAIRADGWDAVPFLIYNGYRLGEDHEKSEHSVFMIARSHNYMYIQPLLDRDIPSSYRSYMAYGAAQSGDLDLIKRMMSLGDISLGDIYDNAKVYGHGHIIDWIMSHID